MTRTQIWNNGGGMQSAAIAALIVQGRLPKPDLSIIADTGRERSSTWDYLNNVTGPALRGVGVEIVRVPKERFTKIDLYGGANNDTLMIPAYSDQGGNISKFFGYCSGEWKRDVIRRYATTVCGVKQATSWMGFSTDEVARAVRFQDSRKNKGKWACRFPLIELGLNRGDCIALVQRMGWPAPPRSSCWMCPNMRMDEWRQVKADERDWPKAIEFDRKLREADSHVWLTDQALPLEQVDFDDANEVLFGRERGACDSGMCFV